MRKIIVLVAILALPACMTPPAPDSVAVTTPFNVSDFAWSAQPGDSSISGQGFMKTRGGEVRTCAGNSVVLVPQNAYTSEMSMILRQRKQPIHTSEYKKYRRETICDASGNFSFKELPAGKWTISVLVNWEAPSQYGLLAQGGYLSKNVETATGKETKIFLTDTDRLV